MKLRKELLALAASILVIVMALGAFTKLVTPKRHSFGSTWGHYQQEEPDSIDVLFIGSSLTYCNIIPALFWEETGLTAYDVTGPALTVPGEYYFLREALKTQSPSVVFVEITAALYERYTGHTETMLGFLPWGENRILAALNEAEPEKVGGLLFPMLTYHSRWTELEDDDWKVFREGYDRDIMAGYTYLGEYRVMEDYSIRNDDSAQEVVDRNMEYLHKIAQIPPYRSCRLSEWRRSAGSWSRSKERWWSTSMITVGRSERSWTATISMSSISMWPERRNSAAIWDSGHWPT